MALSFASRMLIPAVSGLLVMLSACGRPGPEPNPLGTLGSNTTIGSMALHNVYIVGPRKNQYDPGDQARVRLTLISNASHSDALVEVTSEVARDSSLHWDRTCDGTAEQVDRIPVAAGGLVPDSSLATTARPSTVTVEQESVLHQPYYAMLTVEEEIRRGTTVPITFTFERAGTGTLEVLVQSKHPADERSGFACL